MEVTALPDVGIAVVWVSEIFSNITFETTQSVRLQVFNAVGEKIGAEHLVNTTSALAVLDTPSVTALSDGRLVVSWTDDSTDEGDVRAQIIYPRDGIVDGTVLGDTLYGHASVNDEISGFAAMIPSMP